MFSYAGMCAVLHTLCRRQPTLWIEPLTTTAFGRQVIALRIGGGARCVLLTAAHHANEWITAPLLLRFVREYAAYAAYRKQALPNTVWFVPMVNPDGVDLVTGAAGAHSETYRQAEKIARRYPEIPFPNGWKANAMGVDLNLNYPAGFDRARAIKAGLGFSGPAPCNWPGRAPLDQPESAVLAALTRRIEPELTLALHTQGREIYWSYGDYCDERARRLGEAMARVSGYTLAQPDPISANAGFKDWFEAKFHRPGYTIEAGWGKNPLPPSAFETMYQELHGIFLLAVLQKHSAFL